MPDKDLVGGGESTNSGCATTVNPFFMQFPSAFSAFPTHHHHHHHPHPDPRLWDPASRLHPSLHPPPV